ncbi:MULTISPECIES: 3'(2'),5'-bisphosphate nucleotidase CysQ family protein [unclassified Tolypothrix]|uniref:3'(2'),5'-bisphosphate nucleotidase CysQ family protein n=1 Tax=unclassified Tolypothrix TaxID=2649714 RepID=UPI0005EAAEF8|nr:MULTISPECIES: 3'(2'),5'-bisphosphate nucleotidase CysQ [unclassified Tolypothrix]BAY88604.1 inositol monophosphatase [Microchaete diplosiphon NIES-3275]EKE97229.1 putative 3'(2'),5'-bisphosphate nucleotidase [Tolypothrix sp. PCC 7601]MBE9087034.1 3'(2'),5'-bisphosphate nucleotidase CysQ [Tolypothrix sp. LEGE 11397]UYD29274.1 3'(2'),5'-bisphosphate nucleotidase CysQ [Tolypothrix sp. PCC 7712]UYD34816.1 3'(2'),5'-bisphosphate nucleotidase CysQ [Tolypothrix sp. PCC 7601]
MKDLQEILAIACQVGWGAADILQSYYHGTIKDSNLEIAYKQNEPVTAADIATSQYILDNLQAALGNEDFAYISEETYKSQQGKNNSQYVWIIDPLDGTRDFIDKTGDYAIHIALVTENRPILAVVALPEVENLYYATKGGGTFVETRNSSIPLQISLNLDTKPLEDLTLVVSRSHRNQRLNYLLENLPCQNHKSVGSVGCKIATILEQKADIYISLSGSSAPKDWDIAAPELILTEAGGKFTHFDGTPLQYNTGDISQWGGLLASNGLYHEELCQQSEKILASFSDS